MGVEYSVEIIRGVMLTPEQVEDMLKTLGIDADNINTRDEEDLYDLGATVSRHHGALEDFNERLRFVNYSHENANVPGLVVGMKSTGIYNDAKRGDGPLFEQTIIMSDDVDGTKPEKAMLENFLDIFNISEKPQLILAGRVN